MFAAMQLVPTPPHPAHRDLARFLGSHPGHILLAGSWGWLANGVLFGLYHLHMPWAIPASIINGLIFAFPSKRYRSALIGIIVHSTQSVVFAGLTLSLVLDS